MQQTKICGARMLIEVNVTKPLPSAVMVRDPNGQMICQSVEYEWKPEFCPQCQKVGHICKEQSPAQKPELVRIRRHRKQVTQEWKSKGVVIPEVVQNTSVPNAPQGNENVVNQNVVQEVAQNENNVASASTGRQGKQTAPRNPPVARETGLIHSYISQGLHSGASSHSKL
ncbi:uncharacterized protein LOC132606571 [Lycium barbarum]|uniref:uncharacterized protein LOC132606571 n=1 Tax=Lycium barbarum TaxID=112863 RepID=UPI00293F249E|nr:uncharacterized protein LOC132606571 [Lycium barbarum]